MRTLRHLAPFCLGLLFAPGLLAGCGKDTPIDEGDGSEGSDGLGDGSGGDDGGSDGACETDDNCPSTDICVDKVCVPGDRNNSIEEAEALLWEDPAEGYLNPAEDVDYFLVAADGGEFIKITTTTPEEPEDEDFYNTVVVVRKPNGKVVTVADAFATETGVGGVDSVAFAYLPEAGDYIISVEDDGTYYSDGVADGGSAYSYTLLLEEWEPAVTEPDSAEEPGWYVTLGSERTWVSLGFLLEEPGDVDHVSLDFQVPGTVLYLDGNQNLEGSDASARVVLTDSSGVRSAKNDVGPSDYAMAPRLEAGTYGVEISDVAGAGGPNHWVFLHFIARPDSIAFALEEEANNSATDATAVPMEAYENSSGKAYSVGRAEGDIGEDGDEDWFEVEAPYEEGYLVVCANGALWGSTLAPVIEVYDGSGALVGTTTGSAGTSPNARLENLLLGAETFHLRVVAPEGTDTGLGAWYRLYTYVASFSVSPYEEGGYSCP